jgi:sRNA-binding carbon storage regulator CsrA
MLTIKRKVGQGIRVGKTVQISVHQLSNRGAHLVIKATGLEFEEVLFQSHTWSAVIDGHLLSITLNDIVRGEAVLACEANRELRIDREEVAS